MTACTAALNVRLLQQLHRQALDTEGATVNFPCQFTLITANRAIAHANTFINESFPVGTARLIGKHDSWVRQQALLILIVSLKQLVTQAVIAHVDHWRTDTSHVQEDIGNLRCTKPLLDVLHFIRMTNDTPSRFALRRHSLSSSATVSRDRGNSTNSRRRALALVVPRALAYQCDRNGSSPWK